MHLALLMPETPAATASMTGSQMKLKHLQNKAHLTHLNTNAEIVRQLKLHIFSPWLILV